MEQSSKLPTSSIPKKNSRVTIDVVNAFLLSCERRNLSFDTIRAYKSFLFALAKQYSELPTAPEPLEDFIGTFISSDERRHGCYRVLRVLYNFAEDRLGVTPNPLKKIKPPIRRRKEKKALSKDQIKHLLEFPGHADDIRALLYFLADTGARIGEASNLTSSDVYIDSVRVTGKTGSRVIPINGIVREMLLALGDGRLWNYSVYILRRRASKAFKVAGLQGFTAHALRHSFATNWEGSDIALKYIGGWSSWAMVEHYTHNRIDKAMKEHRQHSPVANLNGHPDNGQSAGAPPSQTRDELAALLDNATCYDSCIPVAEFVYHSLLHNMARNALEVVEKYAQRGEVKDYLLEHLIACAEGNQDPREYDEETLAKDVILEAGQIWSTVAMLLRPFVVEHQTQALIYRKLYDNPEAELEAIQLDDTGTIWQR